MALPMSAIQIREPRRRCWSSSRIRQCTTKLFLLVVLILSSVTVTVAENTNDHKRQSSPSAKEPTTTTNGDQSTTDLADSAEERARLSRERWQLAFKEIKNLTVPRNPSSSVTQWKQLLDTRKSNGTDVVPMTSEANGEQLTDESRTSTSSSFSRSRSQVRRFEGFPSWDRLLQDWADDVKEYTEKIGQENANKEYPMSTMGRPPIDSTPTVDSADTTTASSEESRLPSTAKEDERKAETKRKHYFGDDMKSSLIEISQFRKDQVKMPVPGPAKPGEAVVPHTDISDQSKQIWIVTTASLPWMTGTAVNPLLRAAYLTAGRKEAGGSVTLMLPWLERKQDQDAVYGAGKGFDSPEQQEQHVRTWLRETANLVEASEILNIEWYTAWQNKAENSLYSMGDITALIPAEDVDICILEEPEHLNWYRAPGESWTAKFKHVVGIIHTNYFVYAQEQPAALIRAPGMRLLCSWMCRAHCHRVIKLSGTLGQFAPEKELVENVHGVRAGFLETGKELKERFESSSMSKDPIFGPEAEAAVYFIGKMLWSKGLGSLMELLKYAEESAGLRIKVDMYGGGPDQDEAKARANSLNLDMPFHGPIDHAELSFTHKIFINPSTSEVLCTTVAEALAMGKFVIVPSHPSNDFFAQFPNCLTYTTKEEFVGDLYYALTHSPEPLSEKYLYALSWQAATERLAAAGCIPQKEAELMKDVVLSNEAGIEISLPPLIDDEKERKQIADRLRQSRDRYRQFRSKLYQNLEQNSVLPIPLKRRLMTELNKKLDLDIDDILESPKLRLNLSPAELDKQLLDLYKWVADGPSGDVLRIIGGGQDVAFQDLYIKRQARKERQKNPNQQNMLSFAALDALDDSDTELRTPSDQITQALKRNLLPKRTDNGRSQTKSKSPKTQNKSKMSMSISTSPNMQTRHHPRKLPMPAFAVTTTSQFCPKRNPSSSFSLLI